MSSPRKSRSKNRQTPRNRRSKNKSIKKKRKSKYGGLILDIIQEIKNMYSDLNEESGGIISSFTLGLFAKWLYKMWNKRGPWGYLTQIKNEINRLKEHYDIDKKKELNIIPYIISIRANNIVYKAMTGHFYVTDSIFVPHPVHRNFHPGSDQTPVKPRTASPRHVSNVSNVPISEEEKDEDIWQNVKKEARNIYKQYKNDALEKIFSQFQE